MADDQLEAELRWAREALTAVENQNLNFREAHESRFPAAHRHMLDWNEDRLEDHIERLERDLSTVGTRQ